MSKLFIDTSTASLFLAVKNDNNVKKFDFTDGKKRIAEEVLPAIISLCSDNGESLKDISDIFVTTGPGSYTGERIGLTIAKTLFVLHKDIKIHLISTLRALEIDDEDSDCLCLLDAKNKAYFSSKYHKGILVDEEMRREHEEIENLIDNDTLVIILNTQKDIRNNFTENCSIKEVDILDNMINHEDKFEISSDPMKIKAVYLRGKDERN